VRLVDRGVVTWSWWWWRCAEPLCLMIAVLPWNHGRPAAAAAAAAAAEPAEVVHLLDDRAQGRDRRGKRSRRRSLYRAVPCSHSCTQ